jgi:hypothetical protein
MTARDTSAASCLIRGVLFRPALHDVTVGGLGDVLHGVMPGAVVANGIDGYSITSDDAARAAADSLTDQLGLL